MEKDELSVAVMRRLGDKPSAAMRQALADLIELERDPAYAVNMETYYSARANATCEVCLAGAVLARSGLTQDIGTDLNAVLNVQARYKMYAIDSFRQGQIMNGLSSWLGEELCDDINDVDVSDYSDDPVGFKRGVLDVIAKLEEIGR